MAIFLCKIKFVLKLHVVQIVLHLKSVRGAENLEKTNHVTSVDDCYRMI